MNDIDNLLTLKINENALQYGIPILHAHIRFLEWVLHVSYRLDLGTWQVSRNNFINIYNIFKFINLVDIVKPQTAHTIIGRYFIVTLVNVKTTYLNLYLNVQI